MKGRILTALLFGASLVGAPTAVAQKVVFVDIDATGANDGSSWANAFVFLQDALAMALAGDEVWVAEGVYRPDQGAGIDAGDVNQSFWVEDGITLLGGFSGVEASNDHRAPESYVTVLDGDLFGNDPQTLTLKDPLRADNSRHVIVHDPGPLETRISGFVVSGGAADFLQIGAGAGFLFNTSPPGTAAGLLVIDQCKFRRITSTIGSLHTFRYPGDAPVVIRDSEFRSNVASSVGAGIGAWGGGLIIENSTFLDNEAGHGAAIYLNQTRAQISRSRIAFNRSRTYGAIAIVSFSSLDIWGSTIASNEAYVWGAGGIGLADSEMLSINNVFADNVSPDYGGAIQGGVSRISVVNSTFVRNTAVDGGGAIDAYGDRLTIYNSILWQNESADDTDISGRLRDTTFVAYSLMSGGVSPSVQTGEGWISGDPWFTDPIGPDGIAGTLDDDFSIEPSSIATDSGDPSLLPSDEYDLDVDGDFSEPWPIDFAGAPRLRIGADGTAHVSLGAFASEPVISDAAEELPIPISKASDLVVFPNPATTYVTVVWTGDSRVYARLVLIDSIGRVSGVIHEGPLDDGRTTSVPVSHLRAGWYAVREISTNQSTSFLVRH